MILKNKPFPWICPSCFKKSCYEVVVSYTAKVKNDGVLYKIKIPKFKVARCRKCKELCFDVEADRQITKALKEHLKILKKEPK